MQSHSRFFHCKATIFYILFFIHPNRMNFFQPYFFLMILCDSCENFFYKNLFYASVAIDQIYKFQNLKSQFNYGVGV